MKLRHTVLSLLMLLAGGCKAMSPTSDYPGSEGAANHSADDGAFADEEAREMASAKPAQDVRWRRRARRDVASGVVASPPPPATAPDAANRAEPAVEKPRQDDVDGRHIVYTASMTVSVFNLEDAMEKAEAIPETFGGYIQSMNEGALILRVPSKNLRKVMDELGGFGVVDSRSLQAADVTAEFTDVDSRIRALESTQTQLLALLTKARTVEEALKVRQALDNVNTELEVLKGRMRQLKNQISFSTLTVQLYERGPHMPTPSSNDPFPWVNNLGVESTEWK